MFQISQRILLTVWIGGMWIIGYVVAPVLFNLLERKQAGEVAGQLFTIMSFIGLVCGILLLAGVLYQQGVRHWQQWRIYTLLGMLIIICIGQFVLQPMMAELKSAGLTGDAARQFGQLHGISSILFLLNSLAGLALVTAGLTKDKD
ncbi:MAG: DUF4149 domain-containing protein [Gammaproteobacteria bacterium]|nr:DUF4149 domain-containing protein [Gammaproteobacteria bacterium]MDH5652222.1 DUF4149 domain-containing protein [Gammaproteobacteria bacterium]